MKIRSIQRLTAAIGVALTCVIGVAIVRAEMTGADIARQLQQISAIVNAYSELRLTTIAYMAKPDELTHALWHTHSNLMNKLINSGQFTDPDATKILVDLRERRRTTIPLFEAYVAAVAEADMRTEPKSASRLLEAKLMS